MKKSSMLKLGVMTLLASTTLAACGNSSSKSGSGSSNSAKTQTLNWMQPSNLITLDPSLSVDTTSATTLSNVDEGLLKNPKGTEIDPGVAKSYDVSKDGKTYTFHLRDSKWSNGDPVTAKDFVFSFQRSVDPKTASQQAYLYDHVENYTAVHTGKMSVDKLGVSAPDDHTFVVHLSQPQTYFKYLVAGFYPENQKVYEKYGKKFGTNSDSQVYNGPFKATGWTGTNDTWTLVKNDKYWDAKSVKLQKLNMNVVKDGQTALNEYQTGKLDEVTLSGKSQVNQFKNNSDFHPFKTVYSNFIEMNEDKVPAFKNLKVRQALSMAVDRNEFVNDVLGDGSTTTKGFVGTGLASYKGQDFADASYVPSATSYNLAKAKTLLAEGLKEVGQKSLNLTLTYDDDTNGKATTEFLQSQFEKLPGVHVTNINVPKQQRIARLFAGNFQLCVTGWDPSFADPMAAMTIKTSTNSINFGKWKNSKYDALLNKANGADANDAGKRWNDLVQAEKLLANDQAVVPLYQTAKPTLMKTKVQGVVYNPVGSGWDFSHAYVK